MSINSFSLNHSLNSEIFWAMIASGWNKIYRIKFAHLILKLLLETHPYSVTDMRISKHHFVMYLNTYSVWLSTRHVNWSKMNFSQQHAGRELNSAGALWVPSCYETTSRLRADLFKLRHRRLCSDRDRPQQASQTTALAAACRDVSIRGKAKKGQGKSNCYPSPLQKSWTVEKLSKIFFQKSCPKCEIWR